MDDSNDPSDRASGRRTKVERLLDEYELSGFGDEMVRLWTTDTDQRKSLRSLADAFNKRLLEVEMAEAGTRAFAGEVDTVYALLTGEEGTEGDRTRSKRRLERDGIDVEDLVGDFVTYQAIRTYLKEVRSAVLPATERDRLDVERDAIQRFRGRLTAVVDSKLGQLRNAEDLRLGDYRVMADVSVLCNDCGAQLPVDELLEAGSCNCPRDTQE